MGECWKVRVLGPTPTDICPLVYIPASRIQDLGVILNDYRPDLFMICELNNEQGADDILYHNEGFIRECPRSNFFFVTDQNVLVTTQEQMLKGITRKNIIEVCNSNGIPVEERIISIEELKTAKEAFITSSTKRIIPVHQIDDFTYMLNRPDSVAKKVYDLLVGLE